MESGQAKEFDHPFNLLVNNEEDTEISKTDKHGKLGHFASMVKATGGETAVSLFNIAREKYLSSK